jgi:hypothetical protein
LEEIPPLEEGWRLKEVFDRAGGKISPVGMVVLVGLTVPDVSGRK